jgi:hypothetical protein
MTQLSLEKLTELEQKLLEALVELARSGNVSAAKAALLASEQFRKTRHAELHRGTMEDLESRPVDLAAYLSGLGQTQAEVAARLGRKLRPAERAAWAQAQEDRLLEVRAVELGQMRRGDVKPPRWATKRHGEE